MDKIFAIIFNETVMTTRFVWVGILLFNVEIMNSSFLDIEHLSLEGRLYFAQDRMKGMLSEGALPRMQALRPLIDRWLESERTNVWNSHKAANGETATEQRMAKQPQSSEWREDKLFHRDLKERVEFVENDTTVHEVEKNIGTLD